DIGIDAVSIANNHIGDYGPEAARHTITTLGDVFGSENVFGWSERPAVELTSGLHVVAACFSETNPLVLDDASRTFTADDLRDLLALKAHSPGQLMLYVHWGEEYLLLTAPGLRSSARQFKAAGVAHVVGTHSHVVGAAEIVDGFSATYSLGNFLFHVVRKGNTKLLRRMKRGTVAVFQWDGTKVTLEEFWRSEFDENLNLCLRRLEHCYPGSLLSQLHLRAPDSLAGWSYRAVFASRWFNLGLARLFERVERPSLKKVRTARRQLERRAK
ncbi:MAG: CapA family protein, partial [Candidatus Eisenbacteria bacterium]